MRINYWATLESERCYHIYNRSVGDSKLFLKEKDYISFLNTWDKYLSKYLVTYAYCLIPNHFHFLIKCKSPTELIRKYIAFENTVKANRYLNNEISYNDFMASQFKRFFNSYSKKINLDRNRTGSLWQKKFKRIFVKDKEQFRYLLLYIHHNGIHHKLATEYSDWPYSSYHNYINTPSNLIATKSVLATFSNQGTDQAKSDFIEFHQFHKNGFGGYPNLKKIETIDFE